MTLTQRMAKGAAWMLLLKLTDRGMGLLSILFLARLLVPSDFGLVAIATAIIGVLQLFSAFSFDMALIQNPKAERKHFDTVWTLEVIFACVYGLILVGLSHPAAVFYDEPRLALVMQLLGLSTAVSGFQNVGMVAYRKELQFSREFWFMFVRRCAVFAVTISLAFYWRNYFALIAGTMTGAFVAVALSYLWHPYRPRFSLSAGAELFSFSRWMFINNTLGFLYSRAADFIIARGAGTGGLGTYTVAYEIASLPSSEMAMPINRAVFSGYAKMAGDVAVLRQGLLNVLAVLGLLVIPAAVGLACVARPAVLVALGEQWVASVPLIQILAFHGVLTAVMSCCNYAYTALGKPRIATIITGSHVGLAIPLVIYAAFFWDLLTVGWMILVASLLVVPLNMYFLRHQLRINARDLVRTFWRPVAATVVVAPIALKAISLAQFDVDVTSRVIGLLVTLPIAGVLYVLVVVALWALAKYPDGAESYIREQIRDRWRALSPRVGN